MAGSRFLDHSEIRGLSDRRTDGSTLANRLARWSLPGSYRHLTDCMSGFIVLRLNRCLPLVRQGRERLQILYNSWPSAAATCRWEKSP